MMNRALLIAHHFPPCSISSGVQRSLSYAKHLGDYGWGVDVLTTRPFAHEFIDWSQLRRIPEHIGVHRAFALDARRHLSIAGRYWGRTALPDQWRSWALFAIPLAKRLIRQKEIDLIWSTYPISTAHLIADAVAEKTQVPWVADFRDPMVEQLPETGEWFPQDRMLREARLDVERKTVNNASLLVFCTNSAKDIVRERYGIEESKCAVIPNGYDEEAFKNAEAILDRESAAKNADRLILLHSGVIYPGADRSPRALFVAMRQLTKKGVIKSQNFEVRLRATGNDVELRKLIEELGVVELVTLLPSLSYEDALAEMLSVDGLIVLQGSSSNPAIPAKLYEYFRTGKPILGLVDAGGETANLLSKTHPDSTAPLDDPNKIEYLLARFVANPNSLAGSLGNDQLIHFSRQNQTGLLATHFNNQIRSNSKTVCP